MTDWLIYTETGEPHDRIAHLPHPPPWQQFDGGPPVTVRRDADRSLQAKLATWGLP